MAIRINLVTQFDNKGIKQAQRELAAVGRNISTGLNYAVGAGFAAASAGLVSAIKASSDYLAQMTGVQQVFGAASKSVEDFSKTAAQSAGLSATEALTSAKTFGLFANAAGLGGQAAANFATNLVQLAGDLGSFNEIPTAQVLADISSGLQGQAEPLRKYGVFLTDLKLKEEAKNLAIYNGTGALNDQQKMLASYSLIMKDTKVQQGDFAKYSTDLGNSTKTLTSQLADLSVEIGNAVRPAVAELIPQLQNLVPLIGTTLKNAVASVDWKTFFDAIVKGFTFLIENAQQIATFVTIAWGLTKAFGAIKLALDLVSVATGLLTTQILVMQSATVLGAAITILGVFAALMISSQIGVDKETEALKQNIYYQKKFNDAKKEGVTWSSVAGKLGGTTAADRQLAGEMARYGALGKSALPTASITKSFAETVAEMGNLGGASKKAATDYVKQFYTNIADEASKQRASATLAGLGLSKGLIESITSSQDWRKIFIKVKNSGSSALAQLQTDFNQSAAGAQELADELEKIADYTAAVADLEAKRTADIAQETKKLTDQANDAIQKNNDQLADFKDMARETLATSIETLEAYRNLGNTIDMGQFESEVMSAFDNVKSGLKQALANKSITQESYNNLLDYATKENQALAKIGRQRDELAKKKSLVQALMGDVKSALVGFANINQIAQATTEQVTETTSRVINGLTVQTKRTFEVTKAGNSVADNFRAMVEKARNFVSVLKTLKDQGLNAELFKQIVDAGVEAGTATAEGILAGGPGSIAEINGLFTELQTISEDAAETTAVVMYNNGEDVAGGFINGLAAQDEALKTMAQGMAESFATSFELSLMVAIESAIAAAMAAAEAANALLMAQLKSQIASAIAAIEAEYQKALEALNLKFGQVKTPSTTGFTQSDVTFEAINQAAQMSGATGFTGELRQFALAGMNSNTINVTVKAGVITSGKAVGQQIVSEINKYANANG